MERQREERAEYEYDQWCVLYVVHAACAYVYVIPYCCACIIFSHHSLLSHTLPHTHTGMSLASLLEQRKATWPRAHRLYKDALTDLRDHYGETGIEVASCLNQYV